MSVVFILPSFRMINVRGTAEKPILADHNSLTIDNIPDNWILTAKQEFRIAYGHTSHGGQILNGMQILAEENNLFSFSRTGNYGALSLYDREPEGDLGNPDRSTWYWRTRNLLDDPHNDRNVIMWAWCGQASTADFADIQLYLDLMSQLERDYPNVKFVYMTGHLDGTGENGNLFQRNNQIREYCRTNNKILYDFADIESYDPDGNYFRSRLANDNCDYDKNGNGTLDSNWAEEWIMANPNHELTRQAQKCTYCAHSQYLNCIMKSRAFWTLLAKMAGWDTEACDADGDGTLTGADLAFRRENMEDEFAIWVEDCWEENKACADFNSDGSIDVLDKDQKYQALLQEFTDWTRRCGFKKRGAAIR